MTLEKETLLDTLRRAPGVGLKVAEIATKLDLDGKGRHRLRKLIEELLDAGTIERGPSARYSIVGLTAPAAPPAATAPPAPAKTPPGVVGMIRVHPAGYGFVVRDDGDADVFVPARYRGNALDGDRVRVTTWVGHKGTEGRVDEVVSRGRARLTGQLRKNFLEPDDPRISTTFGHVQLEDTGGAHEGQSVVVEITRYPPAKTHPGGAAGELWGRVTHVLGHPDDPRTEVAKVVAIAGIPEEFPPEVLEAARRVPQSLQPEDFADRIDLRDRPFLTIDPETARDFDDAVCLEDRPDGGIRAWVAVADVSHYVRAGSALDQEARIRGTSVYLPDRAIPMLPRELSAEMCSLKAEEDRCAMVVRLDLDAGGNVQASALMAAVIRSHARLDYAGVAAALAGDFRGTRARYQRWIGELTKLHALSRKMRERRLAKGSLDFDLPEPVVVLDEDNPRLVRDIRRSKSSSEVKEAYQLIEEFMLAANEAVARFFRERKGDTLWRVHAPPSLERLEQFANLAESFGVMFDPQEGQKPLAVQKVLKAVAGQSYERAINFLLLRSLKQAQYDVVPIGHFGLASQDYLHFTSPIRRYPDLIVHRLLKWHLRREGLPSGGASQPPPPPREELAQMAADSSSHERRATEASREVIDVYRAFVMRDRVGEIFDGVVTAVTSFGMFVELADPFVEGLVKIETLGGGGWDYDEAGMKLTARRTGRSFSLGDAVRVKVDNVSVARRRIDLSLAELRESDTRDPRASRIPKFEPPPKRRGAKKEPTRKPPSREKRRRR
jgi:ribonuclease R